ncbi:MAG: decarboxylating NADP(+)-dependent phosphogluconate dehydrogenase [Acidimicrobiia bacterium]|nr:decarboxylating NADP(+)-dependent phosphogluconate dehydrogenase [Acidimicrobiia bacterium]MDH4305859.1 decarboxylating NADP(+)-dependent phosphogluconate dehydrogenase [Acidimicrobiia bacterium]
MTLDIKADIGLIGLAVMGQNLVLNMVDHGYRVAVYNRTTAVTDEFTSGRGASPSIVGADTVEALVDSLQSPRIVMLMVKAGPAVDAVIDQLLPLMAPGDVIVDGGNSLYTDTARRVETLAAHGLRFVGTGVSGGEEGARHGPSIMPGGSEEAWPVVQPILQAVAAKVADGTPCCDWVGPGGAGHYVKMVHNGIEYGDMQVIAEAYALLKAAGMEHRDMASTFRTWGDGILDSFLVDITADILDHVDEDGSPLLENILDAAGQKGTGKWTVISSMELAQPVSLVAEAVFARIVSALKDERVVASEALAGPADRPELDVDDVRDALYGSKIVSYAQGFMLLSEASRESGWDLDLGRVASLWREGCIIRARFLDDITAAYERDPALDNLLLDPFFSEEIGRVESGWRRVVAAGVLAGVAVPAYSAALAFYDAYRSAILPANLIQAQRDYFGAHTYERVDRPRGEFFHTNWTGRGGTTTAGTYSA